MKKATSAKASRRGRPTKAARDCMVPMSVSVPALLRDLMDSMREDGESRSEVAISLINAGIESKRRRR